MEHDWDGHGGQPGGESLEPRRAEPAQEALDVSRSSPHAEAGHVEREHGEPAAQLARARLEGDAVDAREEPEIREGSQSAAGRASVEADEGDSVLEPRQSALEAEAVAAAEVDVDRQHGREHVLHEVLVDAHEHVRAVEQRSLLGARHQRLERLHAPVEHAVVGRSRPACRRGGQQVREKRQAEEQQQEPGDAPPPHAPGGCKTRAAGRSYPGLYSLIRL